MSAQAADPYYTARQELQDALSKTKSDFERWKRILETQNTATSTEFSHLGKTIALDLKSMKVDITNLQKVIAVVEQNRKVFPHIDDEDLESRRRFIASAQGTVEPIEAYMTSARARSKMDADQRKNLMTASGSSTSSSSSSWGASGGMGGAALVAKQQQRFEQNKAEQDEMLHDMSTVLGRLDEASRGINSTLNVHKKLVGDMDQNMTVTEGLMAISLRRMDVLLAKSKNGRICCMIVLFLIVVALFFMIIYI